MTTLADRLAALGPAGLARLLAVRPEVLWEPLPHDLTDLAERLEDPRATAAALQSLPLPCLQAAEALQALGGRAARRELLGLLGADDASAGWVLAQLAERAVLDAPDGADAVLEGSPALAACFPDPLRLGPPVRVLLGGLTVPALSGILRQLGMPAPPSRARAVVLEAAVDALSDPDRVRALVAAAPPEVARWLTDHAAGGVTDDLADELPGQFDEAAYRQQEAAVRWGRARGLLALPEWGWAPQMPAEVARALRGSGYRAPFTPGRPDVPGRAVSPDAVGVESGAAATAFSGHATAVLDLVARTGLAALKAGGVGARELTRLAKASGAAEREVRLVLGLAAAGDLLATAGQRVEVGPEFAAWRAQDPAVRFGVLVSAWHHLGAVPTQDREDGRALPALSRPADCGGCTAARVALLATLAALPVALASDAAGVGRAALWTRPLVHAEVEGDDVPFATTWREAEALGVVALGALSPLGRSLAGGDDPGLVALARTLLPGTVDEVIFGTDLTAVVPGTPSARVTALLDACADREGRGGAVVWRLTPGSVRHALDEGWDGADLERALAEVARGDLPQPLRYLVGDVARRHGSLRVRAAVSVVRGDDVALLAQVAADRSLRGLGLSLVAPTVAVSGAGADEVVRALRSAGYLPVPEDAGGSVVAVRRPHATAPTGGRRRTGAAAAPRAPEPLDVPALAAALVRAGAGRAAPGAGTERTLAALAPRLPGPQLRLLAHAVDAGHDVVIEYVSSTGAPTRRRVGELVLVGGTLQAWDHLRQDERFFTVARIRSVQPAG